VTSLAGTQILRHPRKDPAILRSFY
jgi:hypothetical protein